MKTIHVILVRHCESEENIKTQHLNEGLQRLRRLRPPTLQQTYQSFRLLQFDVDSKVSANGRRQLDDMAMTLRDVSFWENFPFGVCAYSPLQRAKETCLALIPSSLHDKCVSLDLLREIEPYENLFPSILDKRITALQNWLMDQNQEAVVLVGHSRYFYRMLKAKHFMWNCDLWQTAFVFDPATRVGKWTTSTMVFRSPLAIAHPMEGIFAALSTETGENSDIGGRNRRRRTQQANNSNTTSSSGTSDQDDEPQCRICQAKQSECPEMKLFRPCKCSGSQAFVHMECLNQWRATSESAFKTCSVCQYSYQTKKSRLAELARNQTIQLIVAILAVIFLSVLVGLLVSFILDQKVLPISFSSNDVAEYLGVHITLSAKQCRKGYRVLLNTVEQIEPLSWIERVIVSVWIVLSCSRVLSMTVISLVLGMTVTGIVMHLYHYYRLIAHRQDGQWPGMLGFVSIWICNDLRYSLRLFIIFGFFMAAKEMYDKLSNNVRQFSHSLFGNEVLEVEEED